MGRRSRFLGAVAPDGARRSGRRPRFLDALPVAAGALLMLGATPARAGQDPHEHHHMQGRYAELHIAAPARRAEAMRLWHTTLRAAGRYRRYAATQRQGYDRFRGRGWRRPLVFHVRNPALDWDRRTLDPARPESLVYWWPRGRAAVLLGFMFRVPAAARPAFARPILTWHRHREHGHWGSTIMTHVWLTRGPSSALAGCLPVKELEAAIPRFHYSRPATTASGPETFPCRRRHHEHTAGFAGAHKHTAGFAGAHKM